MNRARRSVHGSTPTRIDVEEARSRADLEAVAEVGRRVRPTGAVTADELAHVLAAEAEARFLVARVEAEIAGSGVARPSSVPSCLFAMARVLPAHRRRGVGSAILDTLSAHADAIGRSMLIGRVDERERDAIRYLERRGFEQVGRDVAVALDVRSVAAAPAAPPAGVEIVSLAERPDLTRGAYQVERETVVDVPAPEPMEATSYEQWRALTLEGPTALPAATFVALADGEVVGYAGLAAQSGDAAEAEHLLTAVRRPWRGRGIATALKQAQIAWARSAGIDRLLTENDETNAAMRGVNARLGYEPEPALLVFRGPLVRTDGASGRAS